MSASDVDAALCVIPCDFSKYEHISRMMFSYAYDFTPEVKVGSIDEGYFDLRSNRKKLARQASPFAKAFANTSTRSERPAFRASVASEAE